MYVAKVRALYDTFFYGSCRAAQNFVTRAFVRDTDRFLTSDNPPAPHHPVGRVTQRR